MGLRVTFVDDIKGRGSKIDGQISGSDIVSAKNATDPVLKVFGHEVSHWLEWVAPEEYQTLRQFVEQQGQMNVTMRLFQYRMAGVPLDYDGVLRGFVSDEVGKMIGNPTVLDEFIARNKQNRSLLQRLADALRALWQRLTGKDRQQVRSAEEALLAALKAGEKQAERLEKAGQVQDFGQQNAGVGSGVGDSISYDVNNTPFVTVEEDILDGVPRAMWAQTVSENLKEKFPDGVKVGERLIKINSQSRREMTYSEYTKWLRDNDKNTYADKFRATDNADEIILATQGYINEGLKHTRKDNIKDFARGTVLLRIGGVDYSAEVVVGTTSGGEMLLYDIVNMQKTQIKEEDGHTIQPSLSESRRSGVSVSKTSIPKTTDSVNPHYSLSGTGEASGLDVLRQLAEEMAQDPEQSGGWDALYQLAHEMGQDPGNPLGDMSNEEVIALLDEIAEGKSAGQDIASASPGASVEIGTIDFADRASIMEQLALAQKETAELDHEVCYSVTADGKVWKVSGEAGTVNPSGISSSLAGSYSFHNHPREKTWHSFSPEDVRSFFKLGEQLAKASDYLYEYTMERTEDTVDIDPDEVYNRFIELLQKEVFEMKWKREIDPDKDAFHAAMEILSRELNFKYERKEAR